MIAIPRRRLGQDGNFAGHARGRVALFGDHFFSDPARDNNK